MASRLLRKKLSDTPKPKPYLYPKSYRKTRRLFNATNSCNWTLTHLNIDATFVLRLFQQFAFDSNDLHSLMNRTKLCTQCASSNVHIFSTTQIFQCVKCHKFLLSLWFLATLSPKKIIKFMYFPVDMYRCTVCTFNSDCILFIAAYVWTSCYEVTTYGFCTEQ